MNPSKTADYDVLIIGAGAAGLAAALAANRLRLRYVLIEASSRIGGRAHTRHLLPDCPIDLGCHYLHSAGINPFVGIARRGNFTLQTRPQAQRLYRHARLLTPKQHTAYAQYCRRQQRRFAQATRQNRDVPLASVLTHNASFTPFYTYYLSLLHSQNPDKVSVFDAVLYNDTGEDWLVKEGFGALVAYYGRHVRVSLNCPATRLQWNGKNICAHTPAGVICAAAAIITVSTGALEDIRFVPSLPEAKQSAIDALPLGNYKHFYGELKNNALAGSYDALQLSAGELYFHVRPFGMPYVEASVGGTLADELDKFKVDAQRDFFISACRRTFGNNIHSQIGTFVTSRWRKNRWVRGGFAAARPGHGHCRHELARPLNDNLYFAGEATSWDSYNSVHGAYLSGQRAVRQLATARRTIK